MKQLTFIAVAALISMSSCNGVAGWFGSNTDSSSHAAKSYERDISITAENAYSDLFLDSAAVNHYLRSNEIGENDAQMMRNFYAVRNDQFAWFTSDGPTEQARGFWSLYSSEWGSEKGLDESMKQQMDSLLAVSSTAGTASGTAALNNNNVNSSARAGTNTGTQSRNPSNASTTGANSSAAANIHRKNQPAGTATSTTRSTAAGGTRTNTSNLINNTAASNNRNVIDSIATAGNMNTAVINAQTTFSNSDSTLVRLELWLTNQLVNYASSGKGVVNNSNVYYVVPAKKIDPMQYADSVLNKSDSSAFASNEIYNALKQQLAIYYQAAQNGGWQPIPAAGNIRQGSQSPAISALKRRLQATGDYPTGDTTAVFNDSLATAIKSVQEQFGLQPTGSVNDSLVTALNVPAEDRIEQIILNMNRAIWMKPIAQNGAQNTRYIEVNIPAQMLYAYNGTERILEMPVIVGEEGTSTIAFSGHINQVVFNPDWNIPRSIVENEIMPAMQKDPNYLQKRNMEIVKQGDVPQIRQKPGKENALGNIKFLFPNRYDIYLHDTPNKELFKQQDRRLSHGCIRVADAPALAQFVLGDSANWNIQKIKSVTATDIEQPVTVNNAVPVHITYLTSWVSPNGKMNFRQDVYNHDSKAIAKMFTTGGTPTNMATTPNVQDSTGRQTAE